MEERKARIEFCCHSEDVGDSDEGRGGARSGATGMVDLSLRKLKRYATVKIFEMAL